MAHEYKEETPARFRGHGRGVEQNVRGTCRATRQHVVSTRVGREGASKATRLARSFWLYTPVASGRSLFPVPWPIHDAIISTDSCQEGVGAVWWRTQLPPLLG